MNGGAGRGRSGFGKAGADYARKTTARAARERRVELQSWHPVPGPRQRHTASPSRRHTRAGAGAGAGADAAPGTRLAGAPGGFPSPVAVTVP